MSVPYILDDYDVDSFLRQAIAFGSEKFGYAVTPNVDHLIRFHDEPRFRECYADASYVLLDSRFLSLIFRITKSLRVRVCTGSDLTARLFAQAITQQDRIVLIGGNGQQAAWLASHYGLKDLHHLNPPMGFIDDPTAVARCVEFIEACSPFRFCFLAVGAPQQELLARMLRARGKACGMALCIGASINFLTGAERRAPAWMQLIGMEWLYRLVHDPGRLAKRYLLRGPRVFSLLPLTEVQIRRAAAHPIIASSVAGTETPESI